MSQQFGAVQRPSPSVFAGGMSVLYVPSLYYLVTILPAFLSVLATSPHFSHALDLDQLQPPLISRSELANGDVAPQGEQRSHRVVRSLQVGASAVAAVDERAILIELYRTTGGSKWSIQSGWTDGAAADATPICSWYGIDCGGGDAQGGDSGVVGIDLPDNGLQGSLPSDLYRLPHLTDLNLRDNKLTDAGLAALSVSMTTTTSGMLSPLTRLDLSGNLVTHMIGLGLFVDTLVDLRLTGIRLESGFPIDLLQLTGLRNLQLQFTGLKGTLPAAVGQLRSLQELYIFGNDLTGKLPSQLGYLDQLRVLSAGDNLWTGSIPEQLNDLINLRVFNLYGRQDVDDSEGKLSGPVPALNMSPNLNKVVLAHHVLTGTIPSNFLEHNRLTDDNASVAMLVDLRDNRLSGPIPIHFDRFKSLKLQIAGNDDLIGPLPPSFCHMDRWMNGLVERFGCAAIACPAGTYNELGQQVSDDRPCRPCDAAAKTKSQTVGARRCRAAASGDPSSWPQARILAELYLATGGPHWERNDGWTVFDGITLKSVRDGGGDWNWTDTSRFRVCSSFFGVTCGSSSGELELLELANNGLAGSIPASLWHLDHLRRLDLSYNGIDVASLQAVSRAGRLAELELSHTDLSTLEGIGFAVQLQELFLNGNDFGEALPAELGQLTQLTRLHLEESFLSGTIPTEFSNLTSLTRLTLHQNELHGSIPDFLATALTGLEFLDLSDNRLGGGLSAAAWNSLQAMKTLRLRRLAGGFGGRLPAFDNAPHLRELTLAYNAFAGPIPDNFLAAVAAAQGKETDGVLIVDLTRNELSGTVPSSLAVLQRLDLQLADNLINVLPESLCDRSDWMRGQVAAVAAMGRDGCDAILCPPGTWNPIGRATAADGGIDACLTCPGNAYHGETVCEHGVGAVDRTIETIILDELYEATGGRYWTKPHVNWTKAGIPICHREGVVCSDPANDPNRGVAALHLNQYGLTGTVPDSVFDLPGLRILGLSFNDVDIRLSSVYKAQKLQGLLLSETSVTTLEGLENATVALAEVHFAKNHWQGTLPTQFLQMPGLKSLYLNENELTGTIPAALGNLNLNVLSLWQNQFVGQLPAQLAFMTSLQNLLLYDNYLSGIIAPELFHNLTLLQQLDLSNQLGHNKLTGPVPSFDRATSLTTLRLNNNTFFGTVPPNLLEAVQDKAVITVVVDLSFNKLTGPVPASLQSFPRLDIELVGNMIDEIPSALCGMGGWMGGDVGRFSLSPDAATVSNGPETSCQVILCPPGTALPRGRQVSVDQPCQDCVDGLTAAPYYGSTDCLAGAPSDSNHVFNDGEQRAVLSEFHRVLGGHEWVYQDGWLHEDAAVCDWFGVTCDGGGAIVALELENNKLQWDRNSTESNRRGPLTILSALPHLKELNLNGNYLPRLDFESVPVNYNLRILRLSGSSLQSLAGISHLSNLEALHATENVLAGPLPPNLFSLTALRELYLSFNQLTGSLSTLISGLRSLEELYLWDNLITGTLPSEFGSLDKLRAVELGRNLLYGSIPVEISSLPSLEEFSALWQKGYDRTIDGPLPDFANAPNLWFLDLSKNGLSGPIPERFLDHNNKTSQGIALFLQYNRLTGTVPAALQRFDNVNINLAGNKITGIAKELCNKSYWNDGAVGSVGGCNAILCPAGTYSVSGRQTVADAPCSNCSEGLAQQQKFLGQTTCHEMATSERETLELIYRETGGDQWMSRMGWMSETPICSWAGVVCAGGANDDRGILRLDLEYNNMRGTLPTEVWSIPHLREVFLGGNKNLTVSLNDIGQAATSLTSLSLYQTLVDSIEGISEAVKLRDLCLSGLTGGFPDELFLLTSSLESLFLSDNFFVGTLPTRIGELTQLRILHASGSDFHGRLPTEIGNLSKLEELVLNDNLFYGELPAQELSSLPRLLRFECSRQTKTAGPKLSGPLPAFDKLPQLGYLAIEGNRLSGPIPDNFLSASQAVQFVNLANNLLTGAVPERLASLPSLELFLTGNRISSLSQAFCDKADWMGGMVGRVNRGCDAILCPSNTANALGRMGNETLTCIPCPAVTSNEASAFSAPFYGSSSCSVSVDERSVLVELFEACAGDKWYRNDFWNSPVDFCDWYGVSCDNYGHVFFLNLASNNLRGTPPATIFNLPNLQVLYLHSNPIDFRFDNIENAKDLLELRIGATGLSSFNGVGGAKTLTALDASFNALDGPFPEEILELNNLRALSMGDNAFSGSLPTSFRSLPYLRILKLNNNHFTGKLPSYTDSRVLHKIYLGGNDLEGSIPADFLRGLSGFTNTTVDLSDNALTGIIPIELRRFDEMNIYLRENKIEKLPISLCGKIKWNGGEVGRYGCDAILCPPGLTTDIGRRSSRTGGCVPCPEADKSYFGQADCTAHVLSTATCISIQGVVVTGLLLVASILLM